MSFSFETTLDDGRTVEVEYAMYGPDLDAGLPNGHGELLSIEDDNRQQVDLINSEEDRLWQEACKNFSDQDWGYDPD